MEEAGFTATTTITAEENELEDIHSLCHKILLRNDEVPVILHDLALNEQRRREPRRSQLRR